MNIVDKIDFLQKAYNDFYAQYIKLSDEKMNFGLLRVRDVKNGNLLEKITTNYLNTLNLIRYYFDTSHLFDAYRIKNNASIQQKINMYLDSIVINKCLNDLLGCRIILDNHLELNEIFIFLEQKYRNNNCIKVLHRENPNKHNYRAVHVYIKKDNYCLPWELQIWLEKDKIINENEHLKKYGRY